MRSVDANMGQNDSRGIARGSEPHLITEDPRYRTPRRRLFYQVVKFILLPAAILWVSGEATIAADEGAEDPPRPIDEQQQQQFRKTVTAARLSMSRRDPAGGKRHTKAALKLAQTPEEHAEAARLDALAQYLEEFWKTMGRVLGGLMPAQEFNVGSTPLIVVETSPTHVTFRSEGRNRTYALRDLPLPVIEALVLGGFTDNADTKILFATYLTMDAQGDRQAARKLWQELIAQGKDVSDLLPELDVPLVGQVTRPGSPSPSEKPDLPEKSPVAGAELPSDPAELRKAEQLVRERFELDRNLASSASGKLKLAEKLATAAEEAELPAAVRFVMLREARDYALAAGKPAAACEVIDRVAEHFSVDVLEWKIEALEQSAKAARTATGSKETAECALKVAEEAFRARRLDEAERLAAIALATAQRTKSVSLLQKVREAKLEIERAAKTPEKSEKQNRVPRRVTSGK